MHEQCGHSKRCYNCEVVPQVAVWSCDCTIKDTDGSQVVKRYIGSAGGEDGECRNCGKQSPAVGYGRQWVFVDEVEFDWEEYKKWASGRSQRRQVVYVETSKEERNMIRELINALPVYKWG